MRNISATLAPVIAASNAIPRTLYHLEMQDKATGATNHLYLTNHEVNLTFGGIEYQSYKIKHSSIKTYLKNQTDNTTVTIDNVDKGMSSYFAYNEFAGQNSTIWKIFLDPITLVPLGTFAAGDYIIQAQGMMDRPKVNEERCEVRIVNIFNREQSYTPWRRFSAKCNWDFCGTECGYNGGNGKARGTATHAGTTTTLRDTGLGTFATDYWKGASLKILSGTNRGEVRYISAYNATTKTFTVESAFPLATDTTSRYIVECDKSKSTCKGYVATGTWYGNEGNFGGFEESALLQMVGARDKKKYETISSPIQSLEAFLPIVYGTASLQGQYTDEYIVSRTYNQPDLSDRIYIVAGGELSSIDECYVNGNRVAVFVPYLGAAPQSFDFHGETKYYKNTALITVQLSYLADDPQWIQPATGPYNQNNTMAFFDYHSNDSVLITVKGLKVQKYAANGSKDYDGDTFDDPPVWSQNPVWCLIDFLLNRASKKLLPAYINFAYAKAAADLCDTLGYKINLVIKEQKKDPEIIDLILNACRGYVTYSTGQMEVNLERAWVHPTLLNSTPAHLFDDISNPAWTATTKKYLGDVVKKTVDNGYRYKCTVAGTTGGTEPTWPTTIGNTVADGSVTWTCVAIADNIGEGSFNYYQEDVNDTPNKIVVKYTDQEIRENMALISTSIIAGTPITSISYSDIKGAFPTSFPWTGYIGAETFSVTADSGTALTISSWTPLKTYPKGYLIFQGAQTFPTETAIYHDYDNQDRVKRVIEKEIDGSAIPTYKQAYNIAEYHGRKSVEGNLKANMKGLMDSLGLTVGNVVNITHALPGWADEKFRITEASESEDEEVDYALELYDDSFYAESDGLPNANLGTTLPNPYAVPGHVTNLSLSEDGYFNTDGSYVPTLTLTYTLPSGDPAIFWAKAKVQTSLDGGATWPLKRSKIDETSRGLGFILDGTTSAFKVGDTVTVRVVSISSNNISADATTAPTVSNKVDGLVATPVAPRGISLEGNPDPNDTVWDGLRFALVWRKASQTGGAGAEGNLGAGGFTDLYWNGDEYELWVSGACIDSGITKEARYDYVYGDGYLAFLDAKIAAANGTATFKVRRISLNQASEWSTITITQAAPAAPTGLTSEFNGRDLVLAWTKAVETDFKYYELVLNGFVKKLTDPFYVYSFGENVKDNTTADPSITYSLKTYDVYGSTSGAVTGTFTNPVPANISSASIVAVPFFQSVKFGWPKATETDLAHAKVRTSINGGANWSSWENVLTNSYSREVTVAELAGSSSKTVQLEVKNVDVFGQESVTAGVASGTTEQIVADSLYTALRVDFLVRDSIFNFGDSATAPSEPSKTTLYWTVGVITWKGTDYTLSASSLTGATAKYVVATLSAGVATLSLKPMTSEPLLNNNQIIIAYTSASANSVGNYLCYVRQANSMMIEGANIRDLTVTSAKITSLTAGKVVTGILTDALGNNYWNLDTGAMVLSGSITITSGSGYGNLSDRPTSLSGINSGEGTKLTGIETGATVGAAWGTNLTGRPTELTDGRVATALNSSGTVVTKVVPASVAGPGAAGLYLGSDYLGYYSGSAWKTYMQNNGNFYLSGTGTHALTWDGSTLSVRGTLNADDVVAGSIRGIGVYGSTHATKGSYLTASCSASDGTLYLKDTIDFPSSGSGWIIDSANDRDAISWTGKTATTLTGCSGVLAHTVSASNVPVVVPAVKAMVMADVVNEMRFYDDVGGGYEEIANIGSATAASGDVAIGSFGTISNTKVGVYTISTATKALLAWNYYGGNTQDSAAIEAYHAGSSSIRGSTGVYATCQKLNAAQVDKISALWVFKRTASGAPTANAWVPGEIVFDSNYKAWICYSAGTPGLWKALGT